MPARLRLHPYMVLIAPRIPSSIVSLPLLGRFDMPTIRISDSRAPGDTRSVESGDLALGLENRSIAHLAGSKRESGEGEYDNRTFSRGSIVGFFRFRRTFKTVPGVRLNPNKPERCLRFAWTERFALYYWSEGNTRHTWPSGSGLSCKRASALQSHRIQMLRSWRVRR